MSKLVPQEISFNIHLDPATPVASDYIDLLHGDYSTFIGSSYKDIFEQGIMPIMQGFILAATVSGGRASTQESVFGFSVSPSSYEEKDGICFVPSMDRQYADGLEDPKLAIHRYHVNLITDTNKALAVLESPYRLAALTIGQDTNT